LITDQGETAFIIENNDQGWKFIGYTQPRKGKVFEEGEIRNAYLAQTMSDKKFEDQEREILINYLENNAWNISVNQQQLEKDPEPKGCRSVYKYKPVAQKVKPVIQELPSKFRIKREIKGDPLAEMPKLSPNPPNFEPTGRYTLSRKEKIDKIHQGEFLLPEEKKLLHHFMMEQNKGFAWDDTERGKFREDFFPPIDMPVIPHKPWVLKNIPIPPGLYTEICRIIKSKLDAGVYEPSNSSYRSRWFCVIKKDEKNLRPVHSLEPLNEVTIAHSGIPPATEALAAQFAGRSCGGMFDLYVGYDERILAESSRDLTTFQTPFGALRLVTLPMGWTNSVPIFHDDVTYILQPEIPEVTIPYIDDVPIKGPKSRYEKADGTYETIKENMGIRKFIWEHFQNLNRVVQRMKYCGGTFSGPKTVLCAEEIIVVGHRCTSEGRKPEIDRTGIISRWPDCKNITDIRMFLGTVGVCRIFIKDFARLAEPLNKLLRKNIPFEWEKDQKDSMKNLKNALENAVPLGNIDYESDGVVVLAVDTSWHAVGYYIYQETADTNKKKTYVKFGSITMNEREARFSQPKRELFGLKRALEANEYLLIGCRKLIVETDAKYIHGMLNHPEMGPNATINRWIEKILMFHFKLRHVPGKTFGPDGLSRREKQMGDETYPPDEDSEEINEPPDLIILEEAEKPLDFEDFKKEIDTRGGYSQELPKSINCFSKEIEKAKDQCRIEQKAMQKHLENVKNTGAEIAQYTNTLLLPKDDEEALEKYSEEHRSVTGKLQDERLPLIIKWLKQPFVNPNEMDNKDYKKLVRSTKRFFVDKNGRLYRRNANGAHKLVVEKDKRMYMMKAAHDNLGHRGFYATKSLIGERFWWPEMEQDISWYCKTCHNCQERQKLLIKIPPIVTHTPSIFQTLHADTMHMTPKSNGCGYILHGCCAMTSWMEGRPTRDEKARTIANWLFEDIICRWGCLVEIITDNGSAYRAATAWLEQKYGIKGIKISPYNSRANGKIERRHWDIRQMLSKATGGDTSKWYWFFHHVLWADRITIRKKLGCSPFFMVTGAQPIIPLDIVEATWLIELPGRILTTAELIGYRAKALAKHRQHVIDMRARINKNKREWLEKYEKDNKVAIKDFTFKPGDLVLIRNSEIESSLDRKMKARYLGPMIIISKSKGGAYVIAELDGSVYHHKVAGFRVIPYFARSKISLPDNLENLIEISKTTLRRIEQSDEYKDEILKRDFNFENISLTENTDETNL
jgi:hypothetical protein